MTLKSTSNNWQTKKLSDIFQIERGGSPRPIASFITSDPDGINWIKIGDATKSGKYIYNTDEKIKPAGLKKTRLVKEGDFILSNSMSFGRPYIMRTSGAIHDGWLLLREKTPEVDKDFFYYLLGSPIVFGQFNNLAAGSTVRNLNTKLVGSVVISHPPLSEQKRIVKILDEIFEKINKAEEKVRQNVKATSAIFESILNDRFKKKEGMKVLKLADVCKFVRGPFGGSLKKNIFLSSGYLVYEQYHAINNDFKFGRYFIDRKKFEEMRRFEIFPNDLIISCSGTMGKIAIVPENSPTGIINQALLKLTPNLSIVNPKYLKYLLETSYIQNKYFKSQNGTAIQNIAPVSTLKDVNINIPSLSEQEKIVNELDDLNDNSRNLVEVNKKKLLDLIELRKSFLQKAFAGEL